MKIPQKKAEREQFYRELIDACFISKDRRISMYRSNRKFYLYGSDETQAVFNRILVHTDTVAAFIYAGETTRFTPSLAPHIDSDQVKKSNALCRRINQDWHAEGVDNVFSQANLWALVYGSMYVKLVPRKNGFTPYLVEPSMFGVYREDVPQLDRQEAMAHRYYITKSDLENKLEGHPRKDKILKEIRTLPGYAKSDASDQAGNMRVIINSIAYSGNVTGSVENQGNFDDYVPQFGTDLVECVDLVVRDDETREWKLVVMVEPDIIIYEGRNLFVPHELQFVKVTPNPLYFYHFGAAEVAKLKQLQLWRTEAVDQIRDLLALNVDPPVAFSGFGMIDEKKFAMKRPGSTLTSQFPNSRAQEFRPTIPSDLYSRLDAVDEQFDQVSGLTGLFRGKSTPGQPGKVDKLAQLGSARLKKMALQVEDSLGELATKIFKLMRAYYTENVRDEDGHEFEPNEVTNDCVIRVDSHSHSPIFADDAAQLAQELLNAHAIDRQTFIEMLNPPGVESLLERLKTIIQDEQAEAKQEYELKIQEIMHKRAR